MYCTSPFTLQTKQILRKFPQGLEVPCGKCTNCKIHKRSEWVMRLKHELNYFRYSSFITLTYDDYHLPDNDSLKKTDLQKFFKRLRKISPEPIKYYACGEYGDTTKRPHYHIILFGLGLSLDHKSYTMDSWSYCDWSVQSVKKNSFGSVTDKSISYVASYVNKKFWGEYEKEVYQDTGREPVFKIASQGIGGRYAKDNKDRILSDCVITVNGISHSIPRYYLKSIGVDSDSLDKSEMIEKEKKLVLEITGQSMTKNDAYNWLEPDDVMLIESEVKLSNKQRALNAETLSNLKTKKM